MELGETLQILDFTFQYVSINTYAGRPGILERNIFTFQYVSINTPGDRLGRSWL